MITEDELYNILLEEKRKKSIGVTLEWLDLIPNYKLKDSPDIVLILKLKLIVLSQNFEIEIPIPIEVEKVGISKALEDLQKFVERERFTLTLPMLIVSEKGVMSMELEEKLKTIFKLKQIPERLIRQS